MCITNNLKSEAKSKSFFVMKNRIKVTLQKKFPLGSLGPLWYIWNGVLLICTVEGVSSVANFITAYEESR